MEYSTVELELLEGMQWTYSYWIFPKIACEMKKAMFRIVFMLLMFRKTQTCLHMPRITAHLHSKLAKRGCLWGGEGERLPSFFSCDIVGSPVSLPLRLWVTNAVGAPVRPTWLFASPVSACVVPPGQTWIWCSSFSCQSLYLHSTDRELDTQVVV